MAHNLPAINLLSFTKEWNFDHTTSSPRNPRSNGQAEAAIKVVKGLLTRAKYSGQDPYLALLAYRSTPIDAHLHSPADMLYQRVIRTTVPQRIRHKDPQAAADWDHLNNRATQSAAYHDCHCKPKSPLYAGQIVPVLNDAKTLWLPATIIRQVKHGSHLVQIIGGGQYRCAHDHIHKCHPDAVKPGCADQHQCSPSYTRILTWVVPSETSDSSPRHCTQLLQQHPNHQLHLQLPHQWTLQGNHQLQLFCRNHPLEVPQRWPAQHLLPLTDQPESGSPWPGFLRRCDLDCPWLMNISNTFAHFSN